MFFDVHLPGRLGIYQSVGDTSGPGGSIRALRTIPMFVEIANQIKAFSPNAWVINYTNPMSLCAKTLYHTFPQIKAFGCCHEVFGTQNVLKAICEDALNQKDGIDRCEILVNVLGINHFTWFNEASYKGMDLFPIYDGYRKNHFEEGYLAPGQNWANSSFHCARRVKFDLFRRFGLIAAAGDRHLAEFMPGEEALDLKPTGEEGILLIKALCGLSRIISNVNIPNTNRQIPNLPASAVVETNAVFSRDSIKPLIAGVIPEPILTLITPHVENHELIFDAALTFDRNLVYQAFAQDPLVKGRAGENEIRQLADDMIANTMTFLPKGWN